MPGSHYIESNGNIAEVLSKRNQSLLLKLITWPKSIGFRQFYVNDMVVTGGDCVVVNQYEPSSTWCEYTTRSRFEPLMGIQFSYSYSYLKYFTFNFYIRHHILTKWLGHHILIKWLVSKVDVVHFVFSLSSLHFGEFP